MSARISRRFFRMQEAARGLNQAFHSTCIRRLDELDRDLSLSLIGFLCSSHHFIEQVLIVRALV